MIWNVVFLFNQIFSLFQSKTQSKHSKVRNSYTISTAIISITQNSEQPTFWRVKSSGILYHDAYWTGTNILKDLLKNCFTLQMQALWSLQMPVTIYQLLWHHISEDLNLQEHCCGNFKSHNPNFILQKSVERKPHFYQNHTHTHTKLFPVFKNMVIPVLKTFTGLSCNSPCCLSWRVSCRPLLPFKRS